MVLIHNVYLDGMFTSKHLGELGIVWRLLLWQYKMKFGKASGCAQQIVSQEMLTNLDLEIPSFYRVLFSSVVIHFRNKTQSPWEFQKDLCTCQLAGAFSSYSYLGFGVCLLCRVELLWSVAKVIWELESQPNIYLCDGSYECICPDMLMGTAMQVFAHWGC